MRDDRALTRSLSDELHSGESSLKSLVTHLVKKLSTFMEPESFPRRS
jgi:hypothetical protein